MGERRPIDLRLDDAVVVVTGAAQGIGAAVARAAVAHGAHVAVVDRDESGLARTVDDLRAVDPSRQVVSGVLDVRDDTAVRTWFGEVAARLGPIDVLVNNAGGGFAAPFLEVSEKGQDALVRENFSSVASCIRAVAPHLPPPTSGRGGGGSIITITSIEAHRAAPGYAVYSAMKAAVENLTRTLALELGDRHIRVNTVAPDVIPTPGIGGPLPVTTPLPYAGHVDDVAAAVLFLASDASAFITGTTLHVDGGNHAAGGWHRVPDGSFSTNPREVGREGPAPGTGRPRP